MRVEDFRASLKEGLARNNLFKVFSFNLPFEGNPIFIISFFIIKFN